MTGLKSIRTGEEKTDMKLFPSTLLVTKRRRLILLLYIQSIDHHTNPIVSIIGGVLGKRSGKLKGQG